jgi:hypothetical protein
MSRIQKHPIHPVQSASTNLLSPATALSEEIAEEPFEIVFVEEVKRCARKKRVRLSRTTPQRKLVKHTRKATPALPSP